MEGTPLKPKILQKIQCGQKCETASSRATSETLEFWNLGTLVLCNLEPYGYNQNCEPWHLHLQETFGTLFGDKNVISGACFQSQNKCSACWAKRQSWKNNRPSLHQHVYSTCKYNDNRLHNHHGLEMLTQHKSKPMQQKCKALQQIRYLFEQENLDELSDQEAELGKLCNFFRYVDRSLRSKARQTVQTCASE